METRVPIEKTYKLFIKGEFVRTESGRALAFPNESGVTQISRASRKDAREAVIAAKAGWHSWSGKTAYLRGQVLYRLAEVMEGRKAELIEARTDAHAKDARAEVDAAIDRVVHYAGWADKIASLLSSTNPVAGPHFNVTSPEPTGVVAVITPDVDDALLALVSTVLPVIVSGNGVVVVGPEKDPRTTIVFCECLATSDLPGGVVNVLTGLRSELVPHLAKHMDVHAIDVWTGGSVDDALAKSAAVDATDNVKRVRVRSGNTDWRSSDMQGLGFIEPWVELKTVWHPVGL
ncbi:MAG: aldehyde dehydrogenase family protein [Polyangiales bacterium]